MMCCNIHAMGGSSKSSGLDLGDCLVCFNGVEEEDATKNMDSSEASGFYSVPNTELDCEVTNASSRNDAPTSFLSLPADIHQAIGRCLPVWDLASLSLLNHHTHHHYQSVIKHHIIKNQEIAFMAATSHFKRRNWISFMKVLPHLVRIRAINYPQTSLFSHTFAQKPPQYEMLTSYPYCAILGPFPEIQVLARKAAIAIFREKDSSPVDETLLREHPEAYCYLSPNVYWFNTPTSQRPPLTQLSILSSVEPLQRFLEILSPCVPKPVLLLAVRQQLTDPATSLPGFEHLLTLVPHHPEREQCLRRLMVAALVRKRRVLTQEQYQKGFSVSPERAANRASELWKKLQTVARHGDAASVEDWRIWISPSLMEFVKEDKYWHTEIALVGVPARGASEWWESGGEYEY
ncbi:hypothetical protein EDC01DRAFT_635200 [Geopyxis carbonaria]|nr:hypothetical protein EDC01DRAFT_635200 [Geopyxis carbonaria]